MKNAAIILAIVLVVTVATLGQMTEFTFQGQLQNSSAAANGNFDFEFLLFDSGGSQIGPTQSRNGVLVTNGTFSVNLDFGSSFPGASRFLEIRVRSGGGGAFTTLSPRQPVNSAPYAVKSLTANSADSAVNATNAITAVTATNFTGNLAGDVTGTQSSTTVARIQNRSVAPTAPSNGQVLKYNAATSQWTPDTDNTGSGGGGGTITGVTAGTGLTGGGATGNVTLNIAIGGVGTTQLADGGVTDAKINSISGAKVTGTVANATNAVNATTATTATNATNATNATTATNATQLGGVAANQYLQTNGNGSGLTNLNASSITGGTLANARLGQIPTANIADSAVTSAKIAGGQVVKSLNGFTDTVTLAAGSNISITPSGNILTIASTGGGGGITGGGASNTVPLWTGGTTLGNSVITQTSAGSIGVGNPSPGGRLEVVGNITNGVSAIIGTAPAGTGGGFVGVYGRSTNHTGVYGEDSGTGTGVYGLTTNGIGMKAEAPNPSSIAFRTRGTSWFSGDTTPLNSGLTGTGTGIAVGSAGTVGYISAFDYGAFQPRTLLLNNSGGNVGIGTSAPIDRLTVQTVTANYGLVHTDGTVAVGSFVGGSTGGGWFGTKSNHPLSLFTANSFARLTITTAGLVGIGTTVPDQQLSVNGNASKAGGGSWATFSDERLKNIKGRYNGGLKAVMKLQPLRYEYKKDNLAGVKSDGEHIGFSAQEVEKIIPEAVTKTEQGIRLVNNDPIILAMLNAIKEQQAEIQKLSAQVRKLQRGAGRMRKNRR